MSTQEEVVAIQEDVVATQEDVVEESSDANPSTLSNSYIPMVGSTSGGSCYGVTDPSPTGIHGNYYYSPPVLFDFDGIITPLLITNSVISVLTTKLNPSDKTIIAGFTYGISSIIYMELSPTYRKYMKYLSIGCSILGTLKFTYDALHR